MSQDPYYMVPDELKNLLAQVATEEVETQQELPSYLRSEMPSYMKEEAGDQV
jgi:hypothetical protein